MSVTVEHALRQVRAKIDQPETDPGVPFWPLRTILDDFNLEFQKLWSEIQIQDQGHFLPTATIALVAGTTVYDLASTTSFVKKVWTKPSGGSTDQRSVLPKIPHDLLGRRGGYAIFVTDEVDDDALFNKIRIELSPGVAVGGQDLEILFGAAPYELTHGDVNGTAGASTGIILDEHEASVDDIYAGGRLYIYKGTGAGQVRTVSAYNGVTKEATLTNAWVADPLPDDSGYTSVIPLPFEAISPLILGTALRCLANEETPKFDKVAALYTDALEKLEYAVAMVNPQSPTHTRDTAGYLPGTGYCDEWVEG